MGTLVQAATPTTAPDFALMKPLGYDVTTCGNHEFDFGPDGAGRTRITVAQAAGGLTPTVSTNIHFSGTDAGDDDAGRRSSTTPAATRASWCTATWVVTTANGLKVGFVGIVGADAASYATTKAPVTFSLARPAPTRVDTAEMMTALVRRRSAVGRSPAQRGEGATWWSRSATRASTPPTRQRARTTTSRRT